jgi:hypothetical protein
MIMQGKFYFSKKLCINPPPLNGSFVQNGNFYKGNFRNGPGLWWVYQNNWGSKNNTIWQSLDALQLCKGAFFDKMQNCHLKN